MSIYTELKEAGVPLDDNRSDLYAKVMPESKVIVDAYEFKVNVSVFVSMMDGDKWYDIPFAFDPFFDAKGNLKKA